MKWARYHRAAEKKREEAFVAGMFAGLPLALRLRECPGEGCEVKKEVEKSSRGGAGR